jgi:predicted O-methyltransferase YrrM
MALPAAVTDLVGRHRLAHLASGLRRRCDDASSIDDLLEIVWDHGLFVPAQKRAEIAALLRLIQGLRPGILLEIGSQGGGNLRLFSQVASPTARIASVDIKFTRREIFGYQSLVKPTQRLTCLGADSHAARTHHSITEWLRGDSLDFLFIDGDHSYGGVAKDFEMYSPLVREGGIIAFHDIIPDHTTRFAKKTEAYAGGVHRLWEQLKLRYAAHQEFVEDPMQDGMGIGVLTWAKTK